MSIFNSEVSYPTKKRLEALGIDEDPLELKAFKGRLVKMFPDFDPKVHVKNKMIINDSGDKVLRAVETHPGVLGFDLALATYEIASGLREPHPPFLSETKLKTINRPVIIGGMVSSREDDPRIAKAIYKGFRLGMYALGHSIPTIDYIDSRTGIDPKIMARSTSTGLLIVGQTVQADFAQCNYDLELDPNHEKLAMEHGWYGGWDDRFEVLHSVAVTTPENIEDWAILNPSSQILSDRVTV